MIIGGQTSTKSVELYNYESGEQCYLPNLPAASPSGNAAWLNETAIFCGGSLSSTTCKVFNQSSNSWITVRL